ncbi:MAG: putative toxin-antitoxin system toxin component, PIN family [Thermodesulfobacteriota bacterium]|nr:putative toxin-antitoxin system toxin component, PIN family [Thermodesulfobacteriota bacterium]
MLVVMNTNIVISGLYSKNGASYYLLKAAISDHLPYAISPLVAFEYEGMIHQKIDEGFLRISKNDCEKILDALFAYATVIWKPLQIRPVLVDPSEDKILECAISGGCTHIVTFNTKHFPANVTSPYGIEVMTPGDFLEVWRHKT